jgi:sugar phosphate isomerase/epimerase
MSKLNRRGFLKSSTIAAAGTAMAMGARAGEPNEAKRQFKLGLVTYSVARDWDLPTILDVCKKTGIGAVELRTTHKHGVEPTLSVEKRQEVRKRFADSGVVCWGCGTVCEFHMPEPDTVRGNIEICKKFIQLTADIGGKGVKVRPNGMPRHIPIEKTMEQIGKALNECGKAAADAGIEVWLEVHGPGSSIPNHIRMVMEACGHDSVGVTWNSNATDISFGSVSEAFGMLKKWIRSCHINDLYNDEKGVYPYRELFRLLRGINYDRYTLCEVARPISDPQVGAEFLRYYMALWNELSK